MRRFPSTPRKKAIGMFILFVFIPLFIAWYWVFFLDHKPGIDTLIILGAFAVLVVYLFFRYRGKAEALLFGKKPPAEEAQMEEPGEEGGEELPEEAESEEVEDDLEEQA